MTFFQSIILAFIQGMTEFLPISSSGHLILFQKLFFLSTPPVFFDILLHLGTLGSILVFFRKDINELVLNWNKYLKVWVLIILGSLPAALFGFFLHSKIEVIFNSLTLIAIAWLIFGLLLLLTAKLKKGQKEIAFRDAFLIGLAQAIALFPGVSRSGSTISAALFRGISQEKAFRFSFLLAIPAILGATILEARDGLSAALAPMPIFAMLISGIVGYLALTILHQALKSEKFYFFGYYCLLLGVFTLIFSRFV